ncbi:hypothetical protein K1719_015039 [Acacia pycnantha]|nr:hypothetical protein K1719_015039 [Acacia pycnantha]
MAFWTDKNVKRRVLVEKKSKKGVLLRSKPRQQLPQASVPPSTSFDPDTMLTHPCDRHTHGCYTTCNKKCLALEIHCPKKAGMKEGEHIVQGDDDGDGHDIEEGEHIVEGDDIIDIEEDPQCGEETPTHADGGIGGEQEVKEPGLELRRSQRVVIPSSVLKSPWIDPKRKSKGKRTYDEKDTLFEMCTKSVTRDEADEEFVDMHHYFLTRKELQCLNPRSWINNKSRHLYYSITAFEASKFTELPTLCLAPESEPTQFPMDLYSSTRPTPAVADPPTAVPASAPPADAPASPTSENYDEMICTAIATLDKGKGSTKNAIGKFMAQTHEDLPSNHNELLIERLNVLTSDGQLIMVKKSYQLRNSDASPSSTRPGKRGRPRKRKLDELPPDVPLNDNPPKRRRHPLKIPKKNITPIPVPFAPLPISLYPPTQGHLGELHHKLLELVTPVEEELRRKLEHFISLGSCGPDKSPAEVVAYRYWNYNALGNDDKILDGFYDIYGILNESQSSSARMSFLVYLQGTPTSDSITWEAVLVNRAADSNLLKLEQKDLELAVKSRPNSELIVNSNLVQRLAILVADYMGGPVTDPESMTRSSME